jgi:hypothetical protein
MIRRASTLILAFAACGLARLSAAQGAKFPEFTDPAELQADPDFAIQGEYAGEKIGAQVIALGDGKFNVAVFEGGLPGDGWKRGDKESAVQGERDGGIAKLTGAGYSGTIATGKVTLTNDRGTVELKRMVRKSPTLGAVPPAHAIVLFDGKDAEKWQPGKLAQDGYLDSEATTKEKFGSYHLHVEFRLSYMPQARGQSRSNSGVYLHDCYEIQVLDSFGLKGANNECGGFYSIREPAVNMCLPPLQWQTYDVDFTAPKYEGDRKTVNARVTVRHNGVVIHEDVELPKGTPGRQKEGPAPRPLYLQGHGNHVHFNNVWLEPK